MDSKDYKMIRFFRQLEKEIEAGKVKNLGIITDKDGTIIINEELREILKEIRTKSAQANIHIIANTGRTVADMIDCLKREKIPVQYFDYIVGDNGATCFDVKEKQELFKNSMDIDNVNRVIEEFLETGGKISNIRITDGNHIYAYDTEENREYYKKSKRVIYKENFDNLDNIDITKLTLTGQNGEILIIKRFIEKNVKGGKTHYGQTTFPKKQDNNYRLDFTRKPHKRNCCKIYKTTIGIRYLHIFGK